MDFKTQRNSPPQICIQLDIYRAPLDQGKKERRAEKSIGRGEKRGGDERERRREDKKKRIGEWKGKGRKEGEKENGGRREKRKERESR